ncbi:hypothetical protein VQ02_07345 [Methylobacterium variabile]|uniref:Uncharacterized protein n=2 Tax=Methylobacterium variabile TaxID=298794 RepID=A0A0J6T4E3_9HYPH|nr:hypothetical protein VQ02_07345 [Methylobacterium variabile]
MAGRMMDQAAVEKPKRKRKYRPVTNDGQRKLFTTWLPFDMPDKLRELVQERQYLTNDKSITISGLVTEAIDDLLAKYNKA